MKQMGWTYEELLSTPNEVINNIIRYMNTEGKFNRKETEKLKRG